MLVWPLFEVFFPDCVDLLLVVFVGRSKATIASLFKAFLRATRKARVFQFGFVRPYDVPERIKGATTDLVDFRVSLIEISLFFR
jgi:hypothetical protein